VQAQNREIGLIELHACNSTLDQAGILGYSILIVAWAGLFRPLLPSIGPCRNGLLFTYMVLSQSTRLLVN